MTVWDPTDPERAIEDSVHGPSAVLRRLSISAMPLGDGLYLQPGGYDAYGTSYVDSGGRPISIAEIGKPLSTIESMRQMLALLDWVEENS